MNVCDIGAWNKRGSEAWYSLYESYRHQRREMVMSYSEWKIYQNFVNYSLVLEDILERPHIL